MLTLEDLLARVKGARKTSDGYMAQCPAHDDRVASLSFNEREGKLLLHCHAGCEFDQIKDALHERESSSDTPVQTSHARRRAPHDRHERRQRPERHDRDSRDEKTLRYLYRDADGEVAFRIE